MSFATTSRCERDLSPAETREAAPTRTRLGGSRGAGAARLNLPGDAVSRSAARRTIPSGYVAANRHSPPPADREACGCLSDRRRAALSQIRRSGACRHWKASRAVASRCRSHSVCETSSAWSRSRRASGAQVAQHSSDEPRSSGRPAAAHDTSARQGIEPHRIDSTPIRDRLR